VFPQFMVAGIPWAITTTAVARARISEHSVNTVLITVVYAAATLIPALFFTSDRGLGGAATGGWPGLPMPGSSAMSALPLWGW
jgi:hypothetical protein